MTGGLRVHEKRGRGVRWLTAAGLLLIVPMATIGCGDSEDDRKRRVAIQRTDQGGGTDSKAPTEPVQPLEPIAVVPEQPVEDTGETGAVSSVIAEVSFEEAETVFNEKRYDEAVDMFTAYTRGRPDNVWGHYMLGLSARKAGDQVWAEEAFVKALEIDPGHVKSLLNLSRVLLDGDRPDEALGRIEEALEIEPESNDGIRLLGRAHYELGDEEKAIDAYRRAIMVDRSDAWSMNNLGLVLIRQERFEEALLPLARAVELRNDLAIFHNNLGIALERTGHLTASADAYRAVLAVDDSYEKASISLSRVEELEQDPQHGPVDLGELAQRFVDEIETWTQPVTADASTEIIEMEPAQETDASEETKRDGGGAVESNDAEATKETKSEEEEQTG